MTPFKQAMGAVTFETSAVVLAILTDSSDGMFLLFLFQHALASALLAIFVWSFLPATFRKPKIPVLALLFNFSFFIPLLGMICLLTAVAIASFRRLALANHPLARLALPEFTPSQHESKSRFSQGGVTGRLRHFDVPAPQRLRSLLALQNITARVSNPLLQDMLDDASEDIRLVAYGLLDGREKIITAQIHRELANLKRAKSQDIRMICQRHLAELHWELVYVGLAQGDLRLYALNQALFHADEALLLAPRENGLLFLKGRILHELKRDDEACRIFEQAMANGLPESRVLPYIAEIAFGRGDYRTVRTLLARIATFQATPIMKSVVDFWMGSPGGKGDCLPKGGNV